MSYGADPEAAMETLCLAGDCDHPAISRPISAPLVPATVFTFDSIEDLEAIGAGQAGGFIYSRGAHPNQAVLERHVSRLEGAPAGLACASGMGALSAALMATLQAGDRVIASEALYDRTAMLIKGPLAALGIRPLFVDLSDLAVAAQALAEPTAVVIAESISNPLLSVVDIGRLAGLAHLAGACLVVDNTLATPYHCRPLAHGADVVVHSGSKYLGGHSDTMTGVVAGPTDLIARAREVMVTLGSPAGAFDCWLTARGLKTLAVRMARASANAERVAAYLAGYEGAVRRVHYPGLPPHANGTARRVLERGFGAMVTFEVNGGREAASAFVRALRWIRLAPSFGDVCTTVAYPDGMREGQSNVPTGWPAGLIRLSAGIEDPEDILADLRRGLTAAVAIRAVGAEGQPDDAEDSKAGG